jgi:hypothetical protein
MTWRSCFWRSTDAAMTRIMLMLGRRRKLTTGDGARGAWRAQQDACSHMDPIARLYDDRPISAICRTEKKSYAVEEPPAGQLAAGGSRLACSPASKQRAGCQAARLSLRVPEARGGGAKRTRALRPSASCGAGFLLRPRTRPSAPHASPSAACVLAVLLGTWADTRGLSSCACAPALRSWGQARFVGL